jgi:hypothetical protein
MRQFTGLPYFPGSDQYSSYPLERFFPPVPDGLITGWLKQRLISGGPLIDPIGASPHIILETARAGHSILVTSNNPIISFVLNILSRAPRKSDFQSALAELSFHKRGDERLDNHLRALYITECPACKAKIDAQYFLWKKDALQPFAKRIDCPVCGIQGDYPLLASDQAILDTIGRNPLHYARAIQKVKPESPQSQAAVEAAVRLYHPRPLYFLFTLLNAVESASIPGDQRDLLLALVLSLFDYGNNLWTYPAARNQPKILNVPPQFKETNLWLALEKSIDQWTENSSSIPVENHFPAQNMDGLFASLSSYHDRGNIVLFNGRMKSLATRISAFQTAAILSVFPHPNQAFWTLCALWSAWLWGGDTAAPLKWAFERQRFDWGWYASALYSPLKVVNKITSLESPFLVWMPRYSPGLFAASLTATHSAGYILNSAAIQFDESTAQLIFSARDSEFVPIHQSFDSVIQDQIGELFNNTNEPLSYSHVHATALTALDSKMLLPDQFPEHPSEAVSDLQKQVQKCITNPGFLRSFSQKKEEVENTLWLANQTQPGNKISISDQIEIECIRYLKNHPNSTLNQVIQAICELFPGLYTPSFSLIETIVNSYAMENRASRSVTEPGLAYWRLNPNEDISSRQKDIQLIQTSIYEIGNRLGFSIDFEPVLRWINPSGATKYFFHVISTAQLTPLLQNNDNPSSGIGVIVFPASRSRLVALKLQTNPYLNQNLEQNWKLVKFRLIRQIVSQSSLALSNWEQMIDQDPPMWEEARQLPIFS